MNKCANPDCPVEILKGRYCSRRCVYKATSLRMKGNQLAKGIIFSSDALAKMKTANLGKKRSEETRRKMSIVRRKRKLFHRIHSLATA